MSTNELGESGQTCKRRYQEYQEDYIILTPGEGGKRQKTDDIDANCSGDNISDNNESIENAIVHVDKPGCKVVNNSEWMVGVIVNEDKCDGIITDYDCVDNAANADKSGGNGADNSARGKVNSLCFHFVFT